MRSPFSPAAPLLFTVVAGLAVLPWAGSARAQPGRADDCAVAQRASALAGREGADRRPFEALAALVCAPASPSRPREERADDRRWFLGKGATRIVGVPQGTRLLDGRGSAVRRIENLPDSLEVLLLGGTAIERLENLPRNLRVVDVSGTAVKRIENLPSGVRVLGLRGTQVKRIENLPPSVELLDVRDTPVARIENLTSSVKALLASGSQVKRIENITSTLRILDVQRTPVTHLENLPLGTCVVTDLASNGARVAPTIRDCPGGRALLRDLGAPDR